MGGIEWEEASEMVPSAYKFTTSLDAYEKQTCFSVSLTMNALKFINWLNETLWYNLLWNAECLIPAKEKYTF